MTLRGARDYSAAEARKALRDDGGKTPYADPTGDEAVRNLIYAGIAPPGEWVLYGPYGIRIHADVEFAQAWIDQVLIKPSSRGKTLRAYSKEEAPESVAALGRGGRFTKEPQ